MNTLQTRLELQGTVQQWVNSIMSQYNISPSMMDDALSKVLLNVRELAIQEFIVAAQQATISTQEQVEEESDGGRDNGGYDSNN